MLIATVGLDRLTAASLRADYPDARMIRLPPAAAEAPPVRRGPRPDAVILGHRVGDIELERAGVRLGWDDRVVVVAIHHNVALADVWCDLDRREQVELSPGFLDRFLAGRQAGVTLQRSPGVAPVASPVRPLLAPALLPRVPDRAPERPERRHDMPLDLLLLVADDPLRSVLTVTLTGEGHHVEPVAGEAAARAALASRMPDLLLIDAETVDPTALAAWTDRYAPGVPLVVIAPAWGEQPRLNRPNAVVLPMPFGSEKLLQALTDATRLRKDR
jgi:hypothetical protein